MHEIVRSCLHSCFAVSALFTVLMIVDFLLICKVTLCVVQCWWDGNAFRWVVFVGPDNTAPKKYCSGGELLEIVRTI